VRTVFTTLSSDYLQRDKTFKPFLRAKRSLMTLVLRKLLASSTFAIRRRSSVPCPDVSRRNSRSKRRWGPLEEELDRDYEALDETAEEWDEDTATEPPLYRTLIAQR